MNVASGPDSIAAPQARQFLIRRVEEQASLENVILSRLERRMLSFSETMDSEPDMAAAEEFDEKQDDRSYEQKISSLVRHAFEHDRKSGREDEWKQALDALRDSDFYLLVMVDQAGLRVHRHVIPEVSSSLLPDRRTLALLSIGLLILITIGYLVLFR